MTRPDPTLIRIGNNETLISKLLDELILAPRLTAINWSGITKQTPNMKIGYPGQHLASLITGIQGLRTGARGDDLEDGSEVKSCNRVDQLDTCKDCLKKVLRIEPQCSHCGSENIKRMKDSKWLFSIKSEDELRLLTQDIDRIFLNIADYPNFDRSDFETIRFQAFEIWNSDNRHAQFATLMSNYYHKIFREHIKKNPNKTPAPKNFWPYSYQFYLCNPVKVFDAVVYDANSAPKIYILLLVDPFADRSTIEVENMPTSILQRTELDALLLPENRYIIEPLIKNGSYDDLKRLKTNTSIGKRKFVKLLPYVDQEARGLFDLRDTDKISTVTTPYRR